MKKAKIIPLLTLILALASSLFFEISPIEANIQVDNSWHSKTPMNVARSDLGVANVNGKIYAIGGISVPSLLDVKALPYLSFLCVNSLEQTKNMTYRQTVGFSKQKCPSQEQILQ